MNPTTTPTQCTCQAAPKLIFPCSGASDVGGLSDRAARQMTLDLAGKMYCLAGIGGRVEGILANTRSAAKVLVIDGCKEECARKTMELAGFSDFAHLQLERDFQFEKGATRVTAARIRQIADRGAELLAG
ncbi:MAG TPA: putative zinc-binding protein [Candidatus Paceibacterota bacterium]|nr:putative zinc-binding protein [Verrucomicrobiota bacterium]HSA10609.1 putative zinc-binding protein [Candidatus Paceibacterota bacterium]